jgi:hypothetical protein
MYHYAIVEYKDGNKECASMYGASYSDCLKIVSIAINGENEQIKNAWIESSTTELMEEE